MSTICVFGDSIVFGCGDTEQGGWVNRLRSHLDTSHDVYNYGVSGNSAPDLMLRMLGEISARKSDIVIIGIGINDSMYQDGQDIQESRDVKLFGVRLAIIASFVQKKFKSKLLFVGLTPVDESLTHPSVWMPHLHYTRKRVELFDREIKRVSRTYNSPFVPLLNTLNITTDLADGLHPNSSGHQKIAAAVHSVLIRAYPHDLGI